MFVWEREKSGWEQLDAELVVEREYKIFKCYCCKYYFRLCFLCFFFFYCVGQMFFNRNTKIALWNPLLNEIVCIISTVDGLWHLQWRILVDISFRFGFDEKGKKKNKKKNMTLNDTKIIPFLITHDRTNDIEYNKNTLIYQIVITNYTINDRDKWH